MHRIDKFLAKLEPKSRKKLLETLLQIRTGNFQDIDIKKLKGEVSRYRVRVGKCRIIFETTRDGINIISIEMRNDNTY